MLWVFIRIALASDSNEYPQHMFLWFSIKTYVVGIHFNPLGEAILMSTHNICFYPNEYPQHMFLWRTRINLMSTYNICFYGKLQKIILQYRDQTWFSMH